MVKMIGVDLQTLAVNFRLGVDKRQCQMDRRNCELGEGASFKGHT